jgi:hypothetical protein
MSLLANFPHKCKIARRTRQKPSGGIGVAVDVYSVEQTNVVCWEQQASASEMSDWQKRGISVEKKVFFTDNPNLNEDSLIIITNRYDAEITEADQLVLDVMSFPDPDASAGFGILHKVMCRKRTGSPPNFLP